MKNPALDRAAGQGLRGAGPGRGAAPGWRAADRAPARPSQAWGLLARGRGAISDGCTEPSGRQNALGPESGGRVGRGGGGGEGGGAPSAAAEPPSVPPDGARGHTVAGHAALPAGAQPVQTVRSAASDPTGTNRLPTAVRPPARGSPGSPGARSAEEQRFAKAGRGRAGCSAVS